MKCLYCFLNQPLFRGYCVNPLKKFAGLLVKTMTLTENFEINRPLSQLVPYTTDIFGSAEL